jgi:hypothetical protein
MKPNRIRVFRGGAGTAVVWEKVSHGDPVGKIKSVGIGTFINQEFDSLREAKEFCEAEVERTKDGAFYLMIGDSILQEIAGFEEMQSKLRKSDMVYGITSTTAIGVIAAIGFLATSPFHSLYANLSLAIIAIVFYILFLWVFGLGNIEAAVAMVVLLSCAFLIITAVKQSRARHQKQGPSSALLVTPQTAGTSTHYG